ncbi:MAG: hypothetical protein ACYTF9_11330 [Planctomycetota bacterium]|jgi:hypothetical protein
MALTINPGTETTFTVTAMPRRTADLKTLHRLMRLQPDVQKGLRKLAIKRRRFDNNYYIRAGRPWVDRATTTKLTRVAPGESFTIHVRPQIVNDIKSVERFLK